MKGELRNQSGAGWVRHLIATVGYAGYFPIAPGTFGSAVCLLAVLLLQPSDRMLVIALLLLLAVGTVAAHEAEKMLGHDSGHIVIDEFCGYLVSVAFLPRSAGYLLAAFVLFRIFDVWKPPPVRHAEAHVPGGAGVMLDDVLAGIYANICLQAWIYVRHFSF